MSDHDRTKSIFTQDQQHNANADPVHHPQYYGGKDNPYEAIKVIEAHDLNFSLGNVIKYILRTGKKGDPVEDLKKAKWYIEREIDRISF